MSAPLSAHAALSWLRSLSVDVRAAVVLDEAGAVVAGDPALAARAAAALSEAAGREWTSEGDLVAARAGGFTVAATFGPQALERLARHDVRATARALAGLDAPDPADAG